MMKKKLIKNMKELTNFLNSRSIARQLKFFGSLITSKKFNYELKVGGGSYTNWKKIVISVPEYLANGNYTKEQIYSSLKAMTAHEAGHIEYTPFEDYQNFIKDFVKYFADKYELNEKTLEKIGGNIANSIEDGRDENMVCIDNPGVTKNIAYFRGVWWQENEVKGENELFDFLFATCSYATMGILPKGFAEAYEDEKPELYEMMKSIKSDIIEAVGSYSYKDSTKHIWNFIYKIEEWMVELIKSLPEPKIDEALKDMEPSSGEIGEGTGETDESADSETEATSSTRKRSDKFERSPIHDKFDEEAKKPISSSDEEDGADALEDVSGGLEEDKMVDSSLSMEKIVKEALRSAEEECIEEDEKSIIQADFEDEIEKEKEKVTDSSEDDITAEGRKSILDHYGSIPSSKRDGDWNVPLKIVKNNYKRVEVPQDIKIKARKLRKDFEKIFINKVTINSKNRKRGVLDTTALWKIGNNDYSIFKKNGKPCDTDYAFYVLIDASGSMGGVKYKEAYKAASTLEESLNGFVPLKICEFDMSGGKVNHYVVKDFNDKKGGNASWTYFNHNYSKSGNMDGYNIRVALQELKQRKERKKVLIILSDGQPCGDYVYYGSLAMADVKNAIREGRKDGIHIFNIMFG